MTMTITQRDVLKGILSYKALKKDLKVVFIKTNGKERVMNASLAEDDVYNARGNTAYNDHESLENTPRLKAGNLVVVDTDLMEFRSLKVENVVSVNGKPVESYLV